MIFAVLAGCACEPTGDSSDNSCVFGSRVERCVFFAGGEGSFLQDVCGEGNPDEAGIHYLFEDDHIHIGVTGHPANTSNSENIEHCLAQSNEDDCIQASADLPSLECSDDCWHNCRWITFWRVEDAAGATHEEVSDNPTEPASATIRNCIWDEEGGYLEYGPQSCTCVCDDTFPGEKTW